MYKDLLKNPDEEVTTLAGLFERTNLIKQIPRESNTFCKGPQIIPVKAVSKAPLELLKLATIATSTTRSPKEFPQARTVSPKKAGETVGNKTPRP